MADPFEVRMQFTKQLQRLNATEMSAKKAANYAIRYKDMDEDLHSCILEQLDYRDEMNRANMNNRANIMYFIKELCDSATKEGHLEFVRMTQRDILKIIDAVAPSDGSGAANVKVVRKVLNVLQDIKVLLPQTVLELEDLMKERDVSAAHPAFDENPMIGVQTGDEVANSRLNGSRLDKRQIEQRIEEDRERHKRLRETIWAVSGEDNAEFDKLWEETSDICEDDFIMAREEAEERRQAAAFA
ncbi:hypothetical protein EJ05DRAFT_534707 [Pseudovirgaria hyperparasitica]|uniref:CID domain-containing protein n=1 Tax=Pseudovirgaria hyperparasitica TaxID=470096 RepID=A0A6A6WMG7_9PEZI|nr:uncharacterized protein EJ05DRAFT_534707 [Pseudovirgaria hyperparasitica]KAF2763348.1 hypothetical protein EJ05DRAFT_534707 [Pseudovirgaria hyperparasitica]